MMFSPDLPITTKNEDLFNRANFAKTLANSISNSQIQDGLCIGIFGPWGSGKTSIVNLIVEEMNNSDKTDEEKPIILFFNPWDFSSPDQLIRQYFVMLANKFKELGSMKSYRLSNLLLEYSDFLEVFGVVSKIPNLFFNKIRNKRKDISNQKDKISKILGKEKRKILVVIDDIDRLSNEEIKLIFQLVNRTAKFPNIFYLLAFDKEVVARALSEVQNCDGNAYIEKIVQVPVTIPEISLKKNISILLFKIITEHYEYNTLAIEKNKHFESIVELLSVEIRNVRDFNRILNSFAIKKEMIGKEVNLLDLFVLTFIDLKYPNLYKWIKTNKYNLVSYPRRTTKDFLINKATKEDIEFSLKESGINYVKRALNILKVLFPYLDDENKNPDVYSLLKQLRIGHRETFDRYFALELTENTLSRQEINHIVNDMSYEELENHLDNINEKGLGIDLIYELYAVRENISPEREKILLDFFINKAHTITSKNENILYSTSLEILYELLEYFLFNISKEERYRKLEIYFKNANKNTIEILSVVLYFFYKQDFHVSLNKFIDYDEVEKLEKVFLSRIEKLKTEISLLDLHPIVLEMYKENASDSAVEYLKELFKQDINIVKYSADRIFKFEMNAPYFTNELSKFFTEEELLSSIKRCIEDKTIWDISEDRQYKIIYYYDMKENPQKYPHYLENEEKYELVIQKIAELKNNQY